MGKSTPAAPDYTAAAEKQGESSKNLTEQQTWANRPDQITPFGKQTWDSTPEYDPVTGQTLNKWQQTTTLDPSSQHALDSQLALQSGRSDLANSLFPRAQQEFGNAMDWSNFDQMGQTPNGERSSGPDMNGLQNVDPSQKYNKSAEDAIYGQWSNRQEPMMQQAQAQTDTKLRNQGLKPGDAAYDQQMNALAMQQNDARTNAQYQATIGSGQEASRMQGMDLGTRQQQASERLGANQQQIGANAQNYGQNLSQSNYQTQARQQQIAEAMQKRGFSLNEINAIISGQQVGMPSMPGFNQATKADTVDYMGAAQNQYSAALDAANTKNAAIGNVVGGASSAAMMFSDRRLKRSVTYIGERNGIKLYRYQYVVQPENDTMWFTGVMADEVADIPGAVHKDPSGYDKVDYGVISGRLFPGTA